MTDYFLSLFKHFVTIMSQQLSVFFLNMFFLQFLCKWWLTCYKHGLIFSWGSMSSISQCSFKCSMASCCSSTFNLSSFFTLLAFSYFGLSFHCLTPYFPEFYIILHYLFFLLNNYLFTVF